MKNSNNVPMQEGYVKYDKHAPHLKDRTYRPVVFFSDNNSYSYEIMTSLFEKDVIILNDQEFIKKKKDLRFNIRTLLSQRPYLIVLIEELDYDIIQEVLNIMSYYDYSGILLSRRSVLSKLCAYNPTKEDIDLLIKKEVTSRRRHDKIWDFITIQNMKRASFCTEDFANFSKYGYIVRRILTSIHVHEAKFQFTFEPKHVIIDKGIELRIIQRLRILGNRRFITNIHIN